MEDVIESIKVSLVAINRRLDNIEKDMEIIKNQGDKMSNHIDFVEIIYNKIKNPFHYLFDKIKPLTITNTNQDN